MSALYQQMLAYQAKNGMWTHKAMPLVWLAESLARARNLAAAKRHLMLTLCEDAIRDQGKLDTEGGGIYFRLSFQCGMSDSNISRYARQIYETYQQHPDDCRYPEWILQDPDSDWIVEYPSSEESFAYFPSRAYVVYLLNRIGEPSGQILERLAAYLLSCIPGLRVHRRRQTPSTDYDIVCSIEGQHQDFREELGRYIVCECKDWATPADFTTIAKFCRVLDSAKCRSGILFSREGITGSGDTRNAEREQLKVFQDRGMAILVVDRSDLEAVADGENFIVMLRRKYEQVRLDLART